MKSINPYVQRRLQDNRMEQNMGRHLDGIYQDCCLSYSRVYDAQLQRRGVDLYLNGSLGQTIAVDEKCATKYYNKKLETFSFEIYAENNYQKAGWFSSTSPYNLTDFYMIAYVNAPENNKNLLVINYVDALLISKKDIMDYLRSKGCPAFPKLISLFKEKATYHEESGRLHYSEFDGFGMTQSIQYEEKPINILIPRSVLEELAKIRFFKSSEGTCCIVKDSLSLARTSPFKGDAA